MRKLFYPLLLAFFLISCKPPSTLCENPLTYADTPDPDIVRVGEDYYMVTTTMFYCPMVPIMHSKDLVHWKIVSYVTPDLGELDNYCFKDGKNAYGKGQWATSLQYHGGYFYVLFITNETHKTYIYRTKDANQSNWERVSVIDDFFHDASLLFDNDERVYIIYGNRELRVVELESDLSAVRKDGLNALLVDFNPEGFILCAEGTRFYHIGDWYYLMEIDWPAGGIRTQRCWRSRNLEGPYEQKVVCDGTLGGRNSGIAQGPLVQTQHGDWYALLFQDHGAVGRITTLQPVSWVDGWPICGDNTKPLESFDVKLKPCGDNWLWDNDEFDSTELALVWQWNHKPLDTSWSLVQRPGWMRLTTGQIASSLSDARNTLTQRTVGPKSYSVVKMDASGLKIGDFAGLSAFQSNRAAIGVEFCADGSKQVVLKSRKALRRTSGQRTEEELKVEFSELARSELIWFRIDYDFDEDIAEFSYSYDGDNWTNIDYRLKMSFTLDYFTGYRSALFCYATEQLGGFADFDFFHQGVKE